MDVLESPWAEPDASQADKQLGADDTTSQSQPAASSTSTPSTSQAAPSTASPRPSRGPRRMMAQSTLLSATDDPLGPLGAATPSSGDGALSRDDEPPAPPLKEQVVIRTTMSPQQQQQQPPPRRAADPHRIDDDDDDDARRGPRAPPPVEAARPTGVRSATQPSVSVEQAAKPTFYITVGDPVKIGDLTSSHIVYSVRTKVRHSSPGPVCRSIH